MDVLQSLIALLERKEVKHFKIFAGRAAQEDDARKDLRLFDYIRRSNGDYNDDYIFSRLYADTDSRNAYYRLRNRLADDIGKSLFLQHYSEETLLQVLYLLGLSHIMEEKRQFQMALNYLRKAEKTALAIEHYSLLDTIYSRLIKVSRELLSINPEDYIDARRKNRQKLQKMAELEDILETLEYRIRKDQNYTRSSESVEALLRDVLDRYTQDEELKESAKLQFGIYFVISRSLLGSKNYEALERYLEQTYSSFSQQQLFNKGNHDYRLQMLSWLSNAAFKNRNHQASLLWAEKLHEEMEQYNRLHYDKYRFFYYNSLVINYSEMNLAKAVELLESLVKDSGIESQAYYGLFIYLNLALCYQRQGQHRKAIKALNKLYAHSGFSNTDEMVKLRAVLGELMLRYDLGELEFLPYRIRQVRRQFRDMLKEEKAVLELEFLELLEVLVQSFNRSRTEEFVPQVKAFLHKIELAEEQGERLFKYDEWLKKKANLA